MSILRDHFKRRRAPIPAASRRAINDMNARKNKGFPAMADG
jgi:hypothetical protein